MTLNTEIVRRKNNGYCITVSNPVNARNINRKEHIKKERNK